MPAPDNVAHFSAYNAAPHPADVTDTRVLRHALGQFATGVTVIATRAPDGELVGLTSNSFAALSLTPPLVTWALRNSSGSMAVFEAVDRFVVNVLTQEQVELSRRFAAAQSKRFDGVAHSSTRHGLPILHGVAAWFECRTVSRQMFGDHCLFIAQVEQFTHTEAEPLLFHAGGYFARGARF
jgi:flavin reductase (DIM6/NTAB) family NADH-FMN oxidoreductase RutF